MSGTTRLLSGLAVLVACGAARITDGIARSEPLPEPLSSSATRGEERRDLAALRRATAPFLQIEQAKAAGWSTEITGCMEGPGGGMGYHYANARLVDGNVRAGEPEVLLYKPESGSRTPSLVGVEYIVPVAAWHESTPPRLFGHDFVVDKAFQVWALHVWAWETNPHGMYTDWNPRVNCDADPELSLLHE